MEHPLSRQQQHQSLPRISPPPSSRTQERTMVNNGTTSTTGIYPWMNGRHETLEKGSRTEKKTNTATSPDIYPSSVLNSTSSNTSNVNYNNNINNNNNSSSSNNNNNNNNSNNNNNNNNGRETSLSSIQYNSKHYPTTQQRVDAPKPLSYVSPHHLSRTLEEDYRRAQYRIEQEKKRRRAYLPSNANNFSQS